jgi:hypothetical protein
MFFAGSPDDDGDTRDVGSKGKQPRVSSPPSGGAQPPARTSKHGDAPSDGAQAADPNYWKRIIAMLDDKRVASNSRELRELFSNAINAARGDNFACEHKVTPYPPSFHTHTHTHPHTHTHIYTHVHARSQPCTQARTRFPCLSVLPSLCGQCP